MQRITQKMLERKVAIINKLKGFDNPGHSTIGAYTLDYAYGGVSLHQYVNEHGGVNDTFRCGYVLKRDLFDRMQSFIIGLEAA